MALQFNLFKTPKHRVFNYNPRYYDPQQERAEELRAATGNAKNAAAMSDNERLRHLRSRMHKGFQQAAYHNRRSIGKPLIMRIIFFVTIVTLLILLFYLVSGVNALILRSFGQ